MRDKSSILLLSIITLVIVALACGGGEPTPEKDIAPPPVEEQPAEPEPTEPSVESGGGNHDTVFPLPDDVQNFVGEGGEGMVNFQTSLSLEEVIEFYRQAFAEMGLTEREILTVIDESAFSMVFDGWPNDKTVVIQGVDLGEATNVNVRFEDV